MKREYISEDARHQLVIKEIKSRVHSVPSLQGIEWRSGILDVVGIRLYNGMNARVKCIFYPLERNSRMYIVNVKLYEDGKVMIISSDEICYSAKFVASKVGYFRDERPAFEQNFRILRKEGVNHSSYFYSINSWAAGKEAVDNRQETQEGTRRIYEINDTSFNDLQGRPLPERFYVKLGIVKGFIETPQTEQEAKDMREMIKEHDSFSPEFQSRSWGDDEGQEIYWREL